MIETVDNFYSDLALSNTFSQKDKKRIEGGLEINLSDYLSFKNNKVLSFLNSSILSEKQLDDQIIISVKNTQNTKHGYLVRTGNYVGKFFWDGLEINIGSRFSENFLKRMLNFANDIYLDDVDVSGKKNSIENLDISKFILYYLFIQSLEKAFLLGLPKTYVNEESHELKLKGRLNLNQFIKRDIPFVGKVSSISRDQKEDQEIIDVIFKCLSVIATTTFSIKHVSQIMLHLKKVKSGKVVNQNTIKRALNSKALKNPIFSEYKKVLEYAQIIISNEAIQESNNEDKKYYGFIINVAELFEIYIRKLLAKEFVYWFVESPKLDTYKNLFYRRNIIPDIVMTSGNKVAVFDTKYKRMVMTPRNASNIGDVDRTDFFQINTYMSYYKNQGYDVLLGGLLYPMESFDKSKCHADNWLGNNSTSFIVDGIDVSRHESDNFLHEEKSFIKRLETHIL